MPGHIHVKDEYRKNQLSLQPGGYTVTIKYADGSARSYDKVKDPRRYILSLESKGIRITEVLVDGQPFDWR